MQISRCITLLHVVDGSWGRSFQTDAIYRYKVNSTNLSCILPLHGPWKVMASKISSKNGMAGVNFGFPIVRWSVAWGFKKLLQNVDW